MLKLDNIQKTFTQAKTKVQALQGIDLHIPTNSFTLIKGPSGCGKSTLLFTMGGLLHPNSGSVLIMDKSIYHLSENERRQFTAKNIGFVFQTYHLLPYLTVKENIDLQKKLSFIDINSSYVDELLDELQLDKRLSHKPKQLSAGEKQRVALVRAFAAHPQLILADEPTGNLDPENSEIVFSFFKNYQKKGGTIAMVSHSSEADAIADEIIHIKNGKIMLN